jgi:flavin-binding protein dodecin
VADSVTAQPAPAPPSGPLPDPESVYQVLHVVATHREGWEEAARDAVGELGRTIADLRVARVVEHDVALGTDGELRFRVKLAVSFRVDRRRRLATGEVATVRRVLIVANRTAAGAELMEAVHERIAAGRTEFHVLVPVLVPGVGGAPVWGDAYAGHVGALDSEAETDVDFAWAAAEQRLDEQLHLLRVAGALATGELRPVDPFKATLAVLERSSFDEIIVSTLPAAVSRWLRLDLPSRLARHTGVPIVHIEQRPDDAD